MGVRVVFGFQVDRASAGHAIGRHQVVHEGAGHVLLLVKRQFVRQGD